MSRKSLKCRFIKKRSDLDVFTVAVLSQEEMMLKLRDEWDMTFKGKNKGPHTKIASAFIFVIQIIADVIRY
jgi:hypothetical protein